MSEPTHSSRATAITGPTEESLLVLFGRRLLVASGVGQVVACLIGRDVILFDVWRLDVVFIVVATNYCCHPDGQAEYPQRAPHE